MNPKHSTAKHSTVPVTKKKILSQLKSVCLDCCKLNGIKIVTLLKIHSGSIFLAIILIVFSVILGFVCSPDEIVGHCLGFIVPEAFQLSIFILWEDPFGFPNHLFPSTLIHFLLRANQIHSQLPLFAWHNWDDFNWTTRLNYLGFFPLRLPVSEDRKVVWIFRVKCSKMSEGVFRNVKVELS